MADSTASCEVPYTGLNSWKGSCELKMKKGVSFSIGTFHFQSGRKKLQVTFPLKPEGWETQTNLYLRSRPQTGTNSCNLCSDLRSKVLLLHKQRLMLINNWFPVGEWLHGYKGQRTEVKISLWCFASTVVHEMHRVTLCCCITAEDRGSGGV